MKKFEVLEAHQGDKFYKPGDPETGIRIAEPSEVQHLVGLGLLKEIGDADPVEDAPAATDGDTTEPKGTAEDAATIADLRAEVAELNEARAIFVGEVSSLTTERDNARDEVEALTKGRNDAQAEIADLREQVAALTTERDKARDEAETLTKARNDAQAEVADLTAKLEAATAATAARGRSK